MEVLWMQNFLGLQCDTQSRSSNASSNCAPVHCDDFEGDMDVLFEFSCPFCYLEYDIGSLCSHLEEEHSTESRSVICPVCAVKAGPDIVGHIAQQHSHLFKMQRRRRARKSSSSSSASFSLDPLLSTLINGLTIPESHTASSEAKTEASISPVDLKSTNLKSALKNNIWEQNLEEASNRAKFVQQMVLSTVFRED